MTAPLLAVRELRRAFGGLEAVAGVSFTVQAGQIKAVIGPNGAGKTTLFNLISGTLKPDTGEINFSGQPIHRLPPHRVAAQGLARTFQNVRLFPGMSVRDNVLVGCHGAGRVGLGAAMLCLPRLRREEEELRERADRALRELGLFAQAEQRATELAFGQQRAVELARALAARPRLLLLDEPAAGLNMYETRELAERIRVIRAGGITVLLVEHDMALVMDISDEIFVMNFGKPLAEGCPTAIRNNPEVIAVYLGGDDAAGA